MLYIYNKSILFNLAITALFALYFFFHQDVGLIPTVDESSIPMKCILKGIGWTYLLNVLFSIVCLLIDYFREESPTDDFTGSNLFYRYGLEVQSSTITIGLDKLQPGKTPSDIASALNNFLFTEIKSQFANRPKERFNISFKEISDRKIPKDKRRFIKSFISTQRGSQINHFILILIVGMQLIVHEYYYLKGKTKLVFSVLFFVLAPCHFWTWFQLWVFRNFSLINHLKKSYNNSSYELIDLETILRSMKFLTSSSIKRFIVKENLLTDELGLVINQIISNSQNISIHNSNNVNLSNIKSTIQ
jgi:hypothetical protein